MSKEHQIMTLSRVLIALTFLFCLFVNVQAQVAVPCNTRANIPLDSNKPFPNEMNNFKFFGEGKLSALTFGVSTIDDVRSIFGTPLQTKFGSEIYDYDSDWLIVFGYFSSDYSALTKYVLVNGATVTRKDVVRPEYIGKINYISLRPKKSFPFSQINYPDKSVTASQREGDFYSPYRDRYGLTYKVLNREVGHFIGLGEKANVKLSRGDITEIEYRYPCVIDKNIYVEEK